MQSVSFRSLNSALRSGERLGLAAFAAGLLLAGSARAHHSGAMFEHDKVIFVSGTVKQFDYTNPHSSLQLFVRDPAGKDAIWEFEGEAPSLLTRAGIHIHTLKIGDKVTVGAHPMKQTAQMGQLVSVKAADGKTYTPGGAGSPVPPPS